ncbi:helix-turn-helix domain-containing protein [Brevibacillus borstelensis]|uniref:helix-turn-helix domain-containing protein n=1 Tax=Brevibacillus borstelensis TaxID=45462 RepID=UPI003CE5B539
MKKRIDQPYLSKNDLPMVLTIPEVARFLRIGESTAYELAQNPNFPAVRIGRVVRVGRDELIAWWEREMSSSRNAG